MTKLKLQEDPRQMRFDRVSPALERSFSEEDGECTKAEPEAGRDQEPTGKMNAWLGQHATTTQGWGPLT